MKKQNHASATLHTNIKDISAVGNELSDEQLRIVSGAMAKKKGKRKTRPSSYTPPGKPDTACDNC
jgi:hypothetical protein